MPDKLRENISCIIYTAVICLLSVQILAGCIWGIINFSILQQFGETTALLKMSETLAVTGDTGVIYPALLAVIRTLTLNGPVKYYMVMYILQLCFAFFAWFYFSGNVLGIEGTAKKVWISMAVVTCPYAMQCHEAVLEYSFASSLLCFLITFQIMFIRKWKEEKKPHAASESFRDLSVLSLFWLLLSLLRVEFILIGFIPVLALLVIVIRKLWPGKKTGIIIPISIVAVFFIAIVELNVLFGDKLRLSPIDNIERSMYYRVAWSEDLDERDYWPAEVVTIVDEDTMIMTMDDPGLVRTEFTDVINGSIGRRDTSSKMLSWAWSAFKDNKKGIVLDTVTEIAGYLFSPLVTEIKLEGSGLPGYATGNYDLMRRHAPVFTKYYLRLSSLIYCFILLLVIPGIVEMLRNKKVAGAVLPCAVTMLIAAVIYTFSGNNVWDHRKVLFSTCLWIAVFAGMSVKQVFGRSAG